MLKQQHQLFVTLLCIADAFVISLAAMTAWLAVRIRIHGIGDWPLFPRQWENFFKEPLLFFIVPVGLYGMWTFGLYRPRRDRSIWGEHAQVLKASAVALAGMVVVLWVVGNEAVRGGTPWPLIQFLGTEMDPTRVQLILMLMFMPVMLVAHRTLFRVMLREMRRRGRNQRHAAVIGVGRLGQIATSTIGRNSWTGINVAYFISHHGKTNRSTCLNRPVHGGLDDLEEVLEANPVDAVYLAVPTSQAAFVPDILRRLEKFSVDVRIIPDVQPRYLPQSMTVSELDGMPVLSYRECPLYGLGGFTKRLVDILGAVVGLVVFSPVMLLAALAIRLTSPGPVIFKQRRVSLGGEVFKIYKFRTMYHVADEQSSAEWTTRNDPRITRIGTWLRRTSIDELPQFLNVLKGDMSLVGPRPERPELIERFREDWRGYMLRQHVKAGITGWAQVKGLRGDTSLKKRIQYDLFYVRHWSLLFDLKILWLTVLHGFVHKNAH